MHSQATLLWFEMHPPLPIIPNLPHPHTPEMIHAPTQLAVVIENPPPSTRTFGFGVLDDAMVVRPAHDGRQESTAVCEWAERGVADGVADGVGVACGVAEIVSAVIHVHPGGLEEATLVVVCEDGLGCFGGEDGEFLYAGGGEFEHVGVHAGDARTESVDVGAGGFLGAEDGGVELGGVVDGGVALEFAAPEAAEVEIAGSVLWVDERGGIDGVGSFDGFWARGERA